MMPTVSGFSSTLVSRMLESSAGFPSAMWGLPSRCGYLVLLFHGSNESACEGWKILGELLLPLLVRPVLVAIEEWIDLLVAYPHADTEVDVGDELARGSRGSNSLENTAVEPHAPGGGSSGHHCHVHVVDRKMATGPIGHYPLDQR